MKHNITTRTSIGIIGMPRSGTTIVASFINSLDRATIWGEAHRADYRVLPIALSTRYGPAELYPGNIISQIEEFAIKHNLLVYGTKDVLDGVVAPVPLFKKYSDRYDNVYVTFRDPRKVWQSMKDIGHASGLSMDERDFIDRHEEFVSYCIGAKNTTPIILEKFRIDPIGYMSTQMNIEITGPVILKQYTGGGDPAVMRSGMGIKRKDTRPADNSPTLDEACAAYMKVVRLT